jgi:predicted alpha-1,2-mannosidase
MKKTAFFTPFLVTFCVFGACVSQPRFTGYVNPLLGTATLHDSVDLGYVPKWRTWGAEVFPGASLPNAMVQVSPVTMFGSGAGYQYEDSLIYAFSHTNKGHWNLNHVPIVAATGHVTPDDYASRFSHERESASPGYYSVFLERGGIEAEVTSTLRCAFHRYTFTRGGDRRLIVDLQRANDRIREWNIEQEGARTFSGWQMGGEKVHFFATVNRDIAKIERLKGAPGAMLDRSGDKKPDREMPVVEFANGDQRNQGGGDETPLEVRIGFSFVSVENARQNLEAEMLDKDFDRVRREADDTWNALLGKIRVEGGTERQKGLFYSTLYRSMLWPALRSDVNGDFAARRNDNGTVEKANTGFRLYTDPSFWDDHRNKLVLMAMLEPDVTADVINSITWRGEHRGYMPTFFHGDHASVFVAGTWLRGIREGYDVERAYKLLMKNATVPGRGGRPYLEEYMSRGWISEEVMDPPFVVHDERKAAVTKTQEYAYDDYATAILAKSLGHDSDHDMLMARAGNYKNLFNPANGFMQGRFEDGSWLTPFDPYFPYYAYMYREANGWQSIFYAPHDPEGMLTLYETPAAAEAKLDSLFSEPWRGIQAHNMSVFIGQYCHGNQPDHGFPYMYYWLGKQEKSQKLLDHILENFYDMGPHKLAYSGMDDAGEMSSWYVFNALGLYTFSPADPEYLVTVPIFDRVEFDLGGATGKTGAPGATFTIRREGSGPRITSVTCNGEQVEGYKIAHEALAAGAEIVITAE